MSQGTMSHRTRPQRIAGQGLISTWTGRKRVVTASAVTMAVIGAILFVAPAAPVYAVVPPPPAIGTGVSGSVQLTPTLAPGESVAVTTTGLSAAQQLGEFALPTNESHSGVTIDVTNPENYGLVLSDQVWAEDASMVRFETVVADPSVVLQMEITWIEQGDLGVGGQWTVNTSGPVDRIDLPGYYGLWLVDVTQLAGPPGVFFDTTATVVRNSGSALALSASTVSAAAPSVTASWSGLDPGKTYLATVDWGSPQQRSIVEVQTGPPVPQNIVTTTTARLSSRIDFGRKPISLITRVSAESEYQIHGELRLRVDGVVRSTTDVYAYSGRLFQLRIPSLPAGVHTVRAEFRPFVQTVDPSNSQVLRLLVTP